MQGWLSDPVGLVYFDGIFQCFYQHYPDSLDWGPMHWGHATSVDLATWEDAGIALYPDDDGMIFSGSTVVDRDGAADFGDNALIAYFTLHSEVREAQAFAVSTDSGLTWERPHRRPVLMAPDSVRDFRDPRVLRWVGKDRVSTWVMLLAVGSAIEFYTSVDLRSWTFASRFSCIVKSGESWETPDLIHFEARSDNPGGWMLTIGYMENGPESPTGMRYFVGDFDGHTFTTLPEELGRPVDHGPDFYAAQTWSDAPRTTWVGWLGNWAYARALPATGWKGVLSIPRELSLVAVRGELRLRQLPVQSFRNQMDVLGPLDLETQDSVWAMSKGVELALKIDCGAAQIVNLKLLDSSGEAICVCWDVRGGVLTFDLTEVRATTHAYRNGVKTRFEVPLINTRTQLNLRVLVDGCTLEIFAEDGLTVFSALLPQSWNLKALAASAQGGVATFSAHAWSD